MRKIIYIIIIVSLMAAGCSPSGIREGTSEVTEEVLIETAKDTHDSLEGSRGVRGDTSLNYNELSNGRIIEINYDETYTQKENKYMVIFTHEKCDFCMDLWVDTVSNYQGPEYIYLVDLNEEYNKSAWDLLNIKGVPLMVEVHDGILNNKYQGILNIKDILKVDDKKQ